MEIQHIQKDCSMCWFIEFIGPHKSSFLYSTKTCHRARKTCAIRQIPSAYDMLTWTRTSQKYRFRLLETEPHHKNRQRGACAPDQNNCAKMARNGQERLSATESDESCKAGGPDHSLASLHSPFCERVLRQTKV